VRWNVLSLLKRDGESRGRGGRKRRWIGLSQRRVKLHQDDLYVLSHTLWREPQGGGDLRTAAPLSEELQHLLLF